MNGKITLWSGGELAHAKELKKKFKKELLENSRPLNTKQELIQEIKKVIRRLKYGLY